MNKLIFVFTLALVTSVVTAYADELPSDDKNWEEMGRVTFDGSGIMYAAVDLKARQAGHLSFRIPSYCMMEFQSVLVTNMSGEKEVILLDEKRTRDDGENLFVTYQFDAAYANELKEVEFALVSESDESGCDAHVFLTSDYVGVR